MDEPETRPVTSGSINIETSEPEIKLGTSDTNVWTNPEWTESKEVDINALSALTAFASSTLPPHHHVKQALKFPREDLTKQGKRLSDFLDGKDPPKCPGKSVINGKKQAWKPKKNEDSVDTGSIKYAHSISSDASSLAPDAVNNPVVVEEADPRPTRLTSASSTRSVQSNSSIVMLEASTTSMTDIDV